MTDFFDILELTLDQEKLREFLERLRELMEDAED